MIRVLVVDDSALVRRILADALSRHDDITVVGTACDPYAAREQIVRLRPDVVTLDLEMPRMDGLSFLAKLMRHCPLPVVVVSSLARPDSAAAVRALALGAVDVVTKPGSASGARSFAADLAGAVRVAALARVAHRPTPDVAPDPACPASARAVLALGASTGGPHALERVLRALPAHAPGTLVVQHMPEHFTAAFARRLNDVCPMDVREACDGDLVVPGVALVAPGGRHLVLQPGGAARGACYVARVTDGPPVHHQRPAVDVLFESVARHAGRHAVGALLTGMGVDGARGLLAMRAAGAHTVAEAEQSCVVFGMPKEAIKLGAATEVEPLERVPRALLAALARAAACASAACGPAAA